MILLTKRNLQVLRAILQYARHYHAWPSHMDVGNRVGITTKQSVMEHMKRLEHHNLVMLKARGWQSGWALTLAGYELLRADPVYIDHEAPHRKIRNSPGKLRHFSRGRNLEKRLAAVMNYEDVPLDF